MEDNDGGIGMVGQQIERLTAGAAKTQILSTSGEPGGYYYLIGPDGKAVLTLAKASWHSEALESPGEMNGFIKQRLSAEGALKNPAVFYSEKRIVLVYDFDERRDRAQCELVTSSQYATLQSVAGKAMTQKDFIRMLRVTFRGCLSDGNLLTSLRNINWGVNESGTANIQHGQESLGRQLIAQVQGISVIPEELQLTVPMFENHPFRCSIQCAIDIDAQARTFAITPFPQELRKALESTLDDILIGLSAEGFPPAFRGTV